MYWYQMSHVTRQMITFKPSPENPLTYDKERIPLAQEQASKFSK